MLKIDDVAPDFTLKNDKDENVSLTDFRNKKNVVLYFYPKDNTPGCIKEAISFNNALKDIYETDSIVLGISPDSVKSHIRFIEKKELNFPLLSDPEHSVAEAYGAWGEKKMYGKTYWGILRSTFIIGKDGKIKYVFEKVKVAQHGEDVLNILKTL
jgi:peroxiredoxin Q/BCP